ncbi:MAG TPA: polysaccharide biosynthesis/export family protein [Myxococcales bacterium]|jgi:polysaccharide export outer membrane protein
MKTPESIVLLAVFAALPLLSAAGCASVGAYTWVDDLPAGKAAREPAGYLIAAGDLLNVRVWNQDAMSAKVRVRADGQITVPFLNDVAAAGYGPTVLAAQLQTRLKDFINNPVVTITVEETKALSVPVMGEVAKPGVYPVDPGSGLLPVLAAAGGLTNWAGHERIFVLRPGSPPQRIRFRLDALQRAEGGAGTFQLRGGDQVVVE